MANALAVIEPTHGDNPFWSRLQSETPAAFHAFEHYRDLGVERTQDAAYTEHVERCTAGGHKGAKSGPLRRSSRWSKWGTQHMWVRRALEWDRSLDMVKQEIVGERLATAAAEHAADMAEARHFVMLPLRKLRKRLTEANDEDLDLMDQMDLSTLYGVTKDLLKELPKLAKGEQEALAVGETQDHSQVEENGTRVTVVVKYKD